MSVANHSAIRLPTVSADGIPLGQVLPWEMFGGMVTILSIYFAGAEAGAKSLISRQPRTRVRARRSLSSRLSLPRAKTAIPQEGANERHNVS